MKIDIEEEDGPAHAPLILAELRLTGTASLPRGLAL